MSGLYGTDRPETAQCEALLTGEIPVAVYGLGKMGLPLAGVYAETTGNVIGVDVDPDVVETVNAGESHVVGEPGLEALIAEQVGDGRLCATTDGPGAGRDARIHVIIVPTLLEDREPDLNTIEAVATDIAAGLEPGDLVIAESTLPPGTCREVLTPHLAARSGLEPDSFGVAFCPERTSSGTALRDIRGQYPKVVGGVDTESARVAALIYDELSDNVVHRVSDATTAEAVKVFEGIYRDVNIALANELARVADELEISVREAIETANELPMCQLHEPGPGVGGHCIPYYPHFLLAQTETPMALTATAREQNDEMPAAVCDRLERELTAVGTDLADASVVVLGVTYRAGVEETRASPALALCEQLEVAGVEVGAVDPLVDPAAYGIQSVTLEDLRANAFDAAVLVTAHEAFERIDWADLDPMVVIDSRDALETAAVSDAGHRVYTLGGTQEGQPPSERAHKPDRSVLEGTSDV